MNSEKSYDLYIEQRKLLKKVYNDIINPMTLENKMDATFIISENSNNSNTKLQGRDKYVAL